MRRNGKTHTVIELGNVSYVYPNGVNALVDVSLKVFKGESIAVIGPNGGGKTTLLMIMSGLLPPKSGVIKVFEKLIDEKMINKTEKMYDLRRRIGIIFQNPDTQLFSSTVFDEIAFGPLHFGLSEEEVKKKVEEILESFSLKHLADKHPYELSEGEKRKVSIATVMVMNPELLMLDEPTADLDPKSREELLEIINKLRRDGKTIIVATHDMEIVPKTADKIFVLKQRILSEGSVEQIFLDEELLKKANIDAPGIFKLLKLLKGIGFPYYNIPLSMDDAVESLVKLLKDEYHDQFVAKTM